MTYITHSARRRYGYDDAQAICDAINRELCESADTLADAERLLAEIPEDIRELYKLRIVADTVFLHGREVSFEVAVALMDDDLREALHSELAPCSDQVFLDAYARAHFGKYNDDFVVN